MRKVPKDSTRPYLIVTAACRPAIPGQMRSAKGTVSCSLTVPKGIVGQVRNDEYLQLFKKRRGPDK